MSGDVQLSSNDPARRAAERAALTWTLPQNGSGFGEPGHWTSLQIAVPIGFGIATAAGLWHLLRGVA